MQISLLKREWWCRSRHRSYFRHEASSNSRIPSPSTMPAMRSTARAPEDGTGQACGSNCRHDRACSGHPRFVCVHLSKSWMLGTGPGMAGSVARLGSYFRRQRYQLVRKPNRIVVALFKPPEWLGKTREFTRCMLADLRERRRWRNAFPRAYYRHDQEIAFL